MARMKWLALVVALAAVAAGAPAANAKTPCRNQIYNDWDKDGKIASTYPLSCYRDALRHIPGGDSVYTSLEDDIRAALQAAVARLNGKHVAAQVGHGFAQPSTTKHSSVPPMMDERPHPLASATTTTPAVALASTGGGGGGIPAPLLVLGGLALVLVVAGGVGLAVRANRGAGPGV
jgi:hypothetical protein